MTSTLWTYAAMDGDGNTVTGEIRAGSEGDAVSRVRDLGYRPVSLREPSTSIFSRDFQIERFAGKVDAAELAGSIRQLSAMLRAGVPMMRGLNVIVEQSDDTLERAWAAVRTDIESGDALSAALERHPKVFDTILVSLVRAGEASGTLDLALTQAATALERRAALRRKVRSALAYPIAVLALVGVVVVAMSLFVVPVFRSVYADLGGELPLPTVVVLAVSGFLSSNIIPLIAASFLARAALRRWRTTPAGELATARFILRLPIVGDLIRRTALARASRSLAVLTAAGVPLLEALDIAGRVSGNAVIRTVFNDAGDAIRNGRTLSSELGKHAVIPPLFSQVVAVGEESGDLTEMLSLVGDVYESEVDTAAESLSAVAEPLLIAFLGVVVGGIVLSLYLPMFRLVDLVQ
ncbi:MAG: type II secretion system F family protein [Acidimicrobiales bacterium]